MDKQPIYPLVADRPISCGAATMRLLAKYGVDTVFGIPGVHTLDFCHELRSGPIRHIQSRNEQGAGFMADGYARISGRPGVALVISGPGVTNALTAIGQSFADSIPVLLLSSETASHTHAKGWGALHEIPDQLAVTAPLTALSARAHRPEDVPELLAQAFTIFHSRRPRPVHLSIPTDVLALPVTEDWQPAVMPARPLPDLQAVQAAAALLQAAKRPVLLLGGGAIGAAVPLRQLVEQLGAAIVSSAAGKGIIPDDHPLCLSAATVRPEVQAYLETADVILAVGTEIAETDSSVERLPLRGRIIRIDIDSCKLNQQYPATVAIGADAKAAVEQLLAVGGYAAAQDRQALASELAALRQRIHANLTASEKRHLKLLQAFEAGLPADTFYAGDICQLVYTGCFGIRLQQPRCWSYPAGFCTLGCGLPNAIGAKLADPDRPLLCLAGDGGFMFTVQELIVAAELRLALPVVIWENGGLKQIQEDMRLRSIPLVGVEGRNPDFLQLAHALGCDAIEAQSLAHTVDAIVAGWSKDRPTVIVVHEQAPWLS